LRSAARQGEMDAAYLLGQLLVGVGALEVQYCDFEEGVGHLRGVVERGPARLRGLAALMIGLGYQKGILVTHGERLAASWFEKAGDLGSYTGYNMACQMYMAGQGGLSRNLNKALQIVEKMERCGDASSYKAAQTYRRGIRALKSGY